MRIIVLHTDVQESGSADEQDTLVQVDAVTQALKSLGHEVKTQAFSLNVPATTAALTAFQPDYVFNLVEALVGQKFIVYLASSLLDFLRIPYSGSRTEALFVSDSKLLTKKFLSSVGISVPQLHPLPPLRNGEVEALSEPVILKPVFEHGSVGLDKDSVFMPHELPRLLARLQKLSDAQLGEWFVESYIDGREFNIALLGDAQQPRLLPLAEMLFVNFPPDRPKVLDYGAKWEPESFVYKNTVRSYDFTPTDASLLANLEQIGRNVWQLFGMRGYGRVDLRIDDAGRPWVIDINTNPGIAPDAGFIAAAERAGMRYEDVIREILAAR
jgi:D-alanine-D-alanine ligase